MAASAALLRAIGLSRDAAVSASRLYRIVRKRKRETRRLRVLKSGRADHKPLVEGSASHNRRAWCHRDACTTMKLGLPL